MPRNNRVLVPQARQALERFKQEAAAELGINTNQYLGDLPSKMNGAIGGHMVRRMIALAEQNLGGGAAAPTTAPTRTR